MFKEEREDLMFDWSMIGDIAEGRPNLGSTMNVSVYRLMQFTLRDVLIKQFDTETANRIFYDAGQHAGKMFCQELINKENNFNDFVAELQDKLKELNIGILRVEQADLDAMNFTLTVAEDLDCSGIPVCDEQICTYDEGFINGLLLEYTGENFDVKEVDCWCSGDRVCRFDVKPST
ncbi:MAG: V4R domain-containing protein [Candidatus Electryonea clarkiae]|nr:V4R domain-containing protein [Candidatus Electryonea clarkiae]